MYNILFLGYQKLLLAYKTALRMGDNGWLRQKYFRKLLCFQKSKLLHCEVSYLYISVI